MKILREIEVFRSLTSGEVIADGTDDNYNTIAIYKRD